MHEANQAPKSQKAFWKVFAVAVQAFTRRPRNRRFGQMWKKPVSWYPAGAVTDAGVSRENQQQDWRRGAWIL